MVGFLETLVNAGTGLLQAAKSGHRLGSNVKVDNTQGRIAVNRLDGLAEVINIGTRPAFTGDQEDTLEALLSQGPGFFTNLFRT
jgi:hypothetical protein